MRGFTGLTATLLALASPVMAQDTECDVLAGIVGLPRHDGAPVSHTIRDAGAAVAACEAALAAAPTDGFLHLLLARARLVADAGDAGVVALLNAALGDQPALAGWMLGQLYDFGLAGLPMNPRQARDLYTESCRSWPARAAAPGCTALAVMRIEGRGGEVDETGGFNLLGNLCTGGWGPACTEAAFQTDLRGDGNPQTIAALFQSGCAAGDLLACSQFGFRLELGEGVAMDVALAAQLYQLACGGGEPQGCSNLGEIYRAGLGVRPDMAQAIRLFDLGCAGQDAYACVTLGDIFDTGRGAPRDPERARALFDRACALGDPEACDRADLLR